MVHLFNNRCLLKQMGNIPSAEAEANFYAALKQGALAA
jgi:putative transposase